MDLIFFCNFHSSTQDWKPGFLALAYHLIANVIKSEAEGFADELLILNGQLLD